MFRRRCHHPHVGHLLLAAVHSFGAVVLQFESAHCIFVWPAARIQTMSQNKCHAEGKDWIEYRPEGGTICRKCKCLSHRITVTLAAPQEDDMAGETYVFIVWTHPNTQTSCPLRVMAPHASRTRRPGTGVNSHRLHKVAHRVLEDVATDGAADPTGWEHTYGS